MSGLLAESSDSSTNSSSASNETSAKSLLADSPSHNYLWRDLLVWALVLLVLPLLFFAVHHIVKQNSPAAAAAASVDSLPASPSSIPTKQQERLEHTDPDSHIPLRRVTLTQNAQSGSVCNDGSPPTFYIRRSTSSRDDERRKWLIVLDGGYFCHDASSCRARMLNSPQLTSSRHNEPFRLGHGILSSSRAQNAHWFNVNVVNLPYCSSDLWIGDKRGAANTTTTDDDGVHFMGSRILGDVIDTLAAQHGLSDAESITLAGISAGGIGVLLNSNRLKAQLEAIVVRPSVKIRVVLDSSWLLDLPYSFLCLTSDSDSSSTTKCVVHDMFDKLIDYWRARLPTECSRENNVAHKWDCFIPHKFLPLVRVPVLVIQNMFDETQLLEQSNTIKALQRDTPLTNALVETIDSLRKRVTASFDHESMLAHACFVPACVSHMMLTKSDWASYSVNGVQLQDFLYCWSRADDQQTSQRSQFSCADLAAKLQGDWRTMKLVDKCAWPNCKHTCPKLKHPDTNRSIGVIDYFAYFGLGVDVRRLSHKWKISERSVKRMPYNKLMRTLMHARQLA